MALYLGSEKVKINLDGIVYRLNFYTSNLILNGMKLLSSENYILTDKNGLILTANTETLSTVKEEM